jgi:hypothetical protein
MSPEPRAGQLTEGLACSHRWSGQPPAHRSDASGVETQLGVFRAALILWVSGAFVTAVLGAFASPVAWSLLSGSGRGEHRWGLLAAILAAHALLGAVGVTFGVGFFGFRISYASAVFALLLGGAVGMVITSFLVEAQTQTQSSDPRAIAIPALGLATWPLQLLVGTLLPAFLVNAAASPSASRAATPEVPPYPPYPPYGD